MVKYMRRTIIVVTSHAIPILATVCREWLEATLLLSKSFWGERAVTVTLDVRHPNGMADAPGIFCTKKLRDLVRTLEQHKVYKTMNLRRGMFTLVKAYRGQFGSHFVGSTKAMLQSSLYRQVGQFQTTPVRRLGYCWYCQSGL